jgi:single-strand DNA-binding protein
MIITTIAGNIGKDAVFKSTQGGADLCNFTVAASVGYGDKEQTIWFDVTKWGKGTDKLASFLTKGKQVTVSGELSTREYEGKTYLQLRAEHIKLQGGKTDTGNGGGGHKAPTGGGFGGGGFDDDLDDDIPYASNDVRYERRMR